MEEVFINFKKNLDFRTEEIVRLKYFEAQSFRDIEREFKENLENGKRTPWSP